MGIKFKHVDNQPNPDVKYSAAKRNLPKWQWYILALVLMSPIGYFLFKITADKIFVSAQGNILYSEVDIRSPEDGYLQSITIKEGHIVKEGEVVARFFSPEIDQTIVYLKKEIRVLQTLKLLDHNYELVKLNQSIEITKKYLQESLSYYEKFKELREIGIVTILQLNTAMKDLHAARTQLSEIQRQIAISNKKHLNYIEENYNQKIRLLGHKLDKTLALQHLYILRSPVNGSVNIVVAHAYEQIHKGQILLHILDHEELRIKAFLEAKYITDARQGQVVTIVLPNKSKIEGTIINTPHFARVEPGASKIIKSGSNKIELIIKPNTAIEAPYRVHNIPVKVIL